MWLFPGGSWLFVFFFCLVFFVCGWWWFRLRDTLCFFIVIVLEILFHDVLPWKPTLSPEKWLEDNPFLLKCSLFRRHVSFFFFGPSCLLGRAKMKLLLSTTPGAKTHWKSIPIAWATFFFVDCIGSWRESKQLSQKNPFWQNPEKPERKIIGNGIPQKIPFRLYKPRKSQKQKETSSKNTWVFPKMVGFPNNPRFSYPK